MVFEYQTICHPTSFWPSEYWTSSVFRSPLYIKVYLKDWPDFFLVSVESKSEKVESQEEVIIRQLKGLRVKQLKLEIEQETAFVKTV